MILSQPDIDGCSPITDSPANVPAQISAIQCFATDVEGVSAIENATVSPITGRKTDKIVNPIS